MQHPVGGVHGYRVVLVRVPRVEEVRLIEVVERHPRVDLGARVAVGAGARRLQPYGASPEQILDHMRATVLDTTDGARLGDPEERIDSGKTAVGGHIVQRYLRHADWRIRVPEVENHAR